MSGLLEPVLAGLLTNALSTIARRVGVAARQTHSKDRAKDLATAQLLTSYDVTAELEAQDWPSEIPAALHEPLAAMIHDDLDLQALVTQQMALRILDAPEAEVAGIDNTFRLLVERHRPETAGMHPHPAQRLFDVVDQICVRIGESVREEHADTLTRFQHAAQFELLRAMVRQIERHHEVLTGPIALSDADWTEVEETYREQVRRAHGSITPPDFDRRRRVPIEELYVDPTLIRVPGSDVDRPVHLHEFAASIDRAVLLGNPGGGKSTASQVIAYRTAISERMVPFLVVLRDYPLDADNRLSVVEHLEARMRAFYQVKPPIGFVEHLLVTGRALVIFDGLDELIDTHLRAEATEIVALFANRYPLARVLVSSREVGYEQAPMDRAVFEAFRIADFSTEQVADYAFKWFSQEQDEREESTPDLVRSFMTESAPVHDLRVNPLMLSLMCIIYRGQHFIPRNRPEVYERCATMLFEKWDSSRRIHVELEAGRVVDPLLKHLAYWLLTSAVEEGVTESALIRETTSFLHPSVIESEHDAVHAARQLVEFCRTRAWVFSEAGTTAEGEALFSFTHRTFMEYFAAYQLTRLAEHPEALARKLLPAVSRAQWDVVGQLAVQIENKHAVKGADRVFEYMLSERRRRAPSGRCHVLAFIARCHGFIAPDPGITRRLTREIIKLVLTEQPNAWQLASECLRALVADASEARNTIADELRIVFSEMINTGDEAQRIYAWSLIESLNYFMPHQLEDETVDGARSYWQTFSDEMVEANSDAFRAAADEDIYIRVRALDRDLIDLREFLLGPGADTRSPLGRLFTMLWLRPMGVFLSPLASSIYQQLAGSHDVAGRFRRYLSQLALILDELDPPWVSTPEDLPWAQPGDWRREHEPTLDVDQWWAAAVLSCVFAEARASFERGARPVFRRTETSYGPFHALVGARTGELDPDQIAFPVGLSEHRRTVLDEWARGATSFSATLRTWPEAVESARRAAIRRGGAPRV